MERVAIEASIREKSGKEKAKKIRQAGNIPAIVYARGMNLLVEIPIVSIKKLRTIHYSQNAIIDMTVTGAKDKERFSVLIKDVQYHPLSEEAIHVDFIKVSLEEKIKVNVPVVLKGEPKGVKDGGILEQILWQLVIEALPLDIPQKIEVDVSELGIGHSIHVENLKISGNVKIVNAGQETIATVVEKKEEEVAAATPIEGAPTGPEVIKEKKETEEGEEGEGKEDSKAKEEKSAKAAPEKSEKPGKEEKGKK
ncbi:MAG: 50S ribosomal protein L25 [Candidatus Omnitrophota bacterium]